MSTDQRIYKNEIYANQIICTTRIRDIKRFNWPRRLLYMVLKAYRRFMIYCGQHQRGKSAMSKKSSICTENVGDAAVSREALCDFGGIFESAFSVYKTLSLFPFKKLYNISYHVYFFSKKTGLKKTRLSICGTLLLFLSLHHSFRCSRVEV